MNRTKLWEFFDKGQYFIPPEESHIVGGLECDRCYADETTEHEGCGGRIHTEAYYGDDEDLRFWYMCDKCGWEDGG